MTKDFSQNEGHEGHQETWPGLSGCGVYTPLAKSLDLSSFVAN